MCVVLWPSALFYHTILLDKSRIIASCYFCVSVCDLKKMKCDPRIGNVILRWKPFWFQKINFRSNNFYSRLFKHIKSIYLSLFRFTKAVNHRRFWKIAFSCVHASLQLLYNCIGCPKKHSLYREKALEKN